MPILLSVVLPFAFWSACLGQAGLNQAGPVRTTSAKPTEFGGG
jgi:hypothetical protein